MLIINNNYKKQKNVYEVKGEVTEITILKKNGSALITKIDSSDIEKVEKMGTWFAEWHKDFNSYLAQNISEALINGKSKEIKQSLQAVVMNTNSKAPIKHINGDTLDNRKSNLEIVIRNTKNDYEVINEDEIAVILKDKYGKPEAKAIISKEDLSVVVNDEYSWVYYKMKDEPCVIANTPEGRVPLDRLIMNTEEGMKVHHINLNPLDNRRVNLENKGCEKK